MTTEVIDPFETVKGGFVILNTGHSMPMVGLGTMGIKKEDLVKTLDSALLLGYRRIDTAKDYDNEKEIGDALEILIPKHKLTRGDIFITTKLFPRKKDSSAWVKEAVKDSCERLKTKYIDLYIIQYPTWTVMNTNANKDKTNPIMRGHTYAALEKLKETGVIRDVGVANFELKHFEDLKRYAKVMPAVNQCEFHPHFTRDDLRLVCEAHGVVFVAHSPLAANEPTLLDDTKLHIIAHKNKKSVEQIVLLFPLNLKIPICIRCTNPAHMKINLQLENFKLTQDEMTTLVNLDRGLMGNYCYWFGWRVF